MPLTAGNKRIAHGKSHMKSKRKEMKWSLCDGTHIRSFVVFSAFLAIRKRSRTHLTFWAHRKWFVMVQTNRKTITLLTQRLFFLFFRSFCSLFLLDFLLNLSFYALTNGRPNWSDDDDNGGIRTKRRTVMMMTSSRKMCFIVFRMHKTLKFHRRSASLWANVIIDFASLRHRLRIQKHQIVCVLCVCVRTHFSFTPISKTIRILWIASERHFSTIDLFDVKCDRRRKCK